MPRMKYCNDTHNAVVAYSEQECPLCLMQHRLIELADAQEDIDKQEIQMLWNDMEVLKKRVKTLEREVKACKTTTTGNIWSMQLAAENL